MNQPTLSSSSIDPAEIVNELREVICQHRQAHDTLPDYVELPTWMHPLLAQQAPVDQVGPLGLFQDKGSGLYVHPDPVQPLDHFGVALLFPTKGYVRMEKNLLKERAAQFRAEGRYG
jgi:hypothetical protein